MNIEQNPDKRENALRIGGVSHRRVVGNTHSMVMLIKATIDKGGKAGVAGCKDPQQILDRLKEIGTDAKSEPMLEFISGEKKKMGFVFYCG